jgi:RNA polymerase sigma factor (sigma-70 family)
VGVKQPSNEEQTMNNPYGNPRDADVRIEALWTAHSDRVIRTTARKFGRPPPADPDIQDAVSAAYLRTLRYLRTGGTLDESPVGWLITLSWREFVRARSRKSWSEIPADDLGLDTDRLVAAADEAGHPNPDIDRALEKALATLTPRQRALIDVTQAGYTRGETARMLGITLRPANRQIERARRKLREHEELRNAYRRWSD